MEFYTFSSNEAYKLRTHIKEKSSELKCVVKKDKYRDPLFNAFLNTIHIDGSQITNEEVWNICREHNLLGIFSYSFS